MNTNFKINGQSYRFATTAENVKYGTGTVKEFLDDIKSFDTSGMSDFGKKLYEADEKEFKKLLEISSEAFWDEGQTRWFSNATAANVGGQQVLHMTGKTLQSASNVTFGGDPFTVKFNAYVASRVNGQYLFRALGQSRSFGICNMQMGTTRTGVSHFYTGTTSLSTNSASVDDIAQVGKWLYYEIDYDGAGKVTVNFHGTKQTVSITIPREPRRLILGAFNGYIDDFEIIDNGVTISKLNFE